MFRLSCFLCVLCSYLWGVATFSLMNTSTPTLRCKILTLVHDDVRYYLQSIEYLWQKKKYFYKSICRWLYLVGIYHYNIVLPINLLYLFIWTILWTSSNLTIIFGRYNILMWRKNIYYIFQQTYNVYRITTCLVISGPTFS